MGKFGQISNELLPLNYVENWFHALSWAFFGRFSSNFVFELILGGGGVVWDCRWVNFVK